VVEKYRLGQSQTITRNKKTLDIKMRKMHGGFSFAGLREAFFVSFTAIFMNLDSVVTYGGAVRLNEGAV